MSNLTQKEQVKNILYNLLPFAVLLGIMLALHRYITLDLNTDDLYFSTIQDRFTLLEFLHHRYESWSGRMSGEALIYTFLKYDLSWWKLVNSSLITMLCYGLTALLLGERFWLRNYRESAKTIWFICLGLGWINMNILGASIFWVTGSFAYLT